VLLGRLVAWYLAFSASVSAIHAATVAGLAPASSAARYPVSLRSHSAILSAVSSWSRSGQRLGELGIGQGDDRFVEAMRSQGHGKVVK
jgi:hypothetical protein